MPVEITAGMRAAVRSTLAMQGKNHRVSITVPSTLGKGPAPDTMVRAAVEATLRVLSIAAGGATATKGQGAWMDGNTLVAEAVTVVQAYYDIADVVSVREAVIEAALVLKESMQQQCIAVEIYGNLYLI